MAVIVYWSIKILSWVGLVFCLYCVIRPEAMTGFIVRTASWKLSWFALRATIQTTAQTASRMRAVSVVMAVVFTGLIYVFTEIITPAYVIK